MHVLDEGHGLWTALPQSFCQSRVAVDNLHFKPVYINITVAVYKLYLTFVALGDRLGPSHLWWFDSVLWFTLVITK